MPLIIITAGIAMIAKPPTTINNTYGYRTKRSQASTEAWHYAQKCSSRYLLISGIALLSLTTIVILITSLFFWHFLSILLFQLFVLVMAIPFTEVNLKRRFD